MTPEELKKLLEEQAKAWEEFKAANDARLAEIEKKGTADAVTAEKVDKINAELTRIQSAFKAGLVEIEKKLNRPALIGEASEALARKCAVFNLSVKAHAQRLSRPLPAEIDVEGYVAYAKAFNNFLRKDGRAISLEEHKTLTVGSDPDGGYLVPEEIDSAIDRVVMSLGAMRGLATVRSIGAATFKKPVTTSGAGVGGWTNETGAPSETTTPRLAELEFTPGTLWAEPRATTELLEDASIDIEAWLADEVGLTFVENEGQAFIDGVGVNKPRGFLAYPFVANASYSWGNIGFVASGGAAGFAAANPSDALVSLIHALKRQYRGGASFVMNDTTLAAIRKFKDGQGIYLWQPNLQLGQVGVLLGHAVATDDFMPDLNTNTYPIGFGDWRRGYLIVDRRGTVVIRDNLTAKPYVKFYTTRRVGGGVQNFEAIKVMKCST